MKRFVICSTILVAALSATCGSAAINNGIAVTALPAPDGDGAYAFGNEQYTTSNFFDDQLAAGLAYPVWDSIGVPEGATVKFVGGVALSSLPAGCAFDFSGATHVFVTDAAVFGSGFTIPENVRLLFQPCSVTVSGTAASFTLSSRTGAVDVPFSIDGMLTVGRNANVVFNDAVTGSEQGTIQMNGFDRRVTFNGALDFGGTIHFGTSQRNERIEVNSSEPESCIGTVDGLDWGNGSLTETHRAPLQLLYRPASETPCTLVVSNFNQRENGGLLSPEPTGHFQYRRWGVLLSVCSNNTLRIGNIVSHGAIHLLAASTGAYTFGNEPAFDEGFANVEVVHLGNNNGRANRRSEFYPSPNVNLSITGRFTGFESISPSFNYTAESNAVNRGSLDMSRGEVYWYGRPPVSITGYSPWNLPRTIKCHSSLRDRTTVTVSDDRWLMPLDFGAETNEINVARCETDAILQVPASGTVVVSNATTAAGARVVPGRYPVITGSSGAAALKNWTLERVGTRWAGAIVTLKATDEGLWIVVDVPCETLLILR